MIYRISRANPHKREGNAAFPATILDQVLVSGENVVFQAEFHSSNALALAGAMLA